MKRKKAKSLKEAEAEWYAILYDKGFRDIENTSLPDRPLKEWHSLKYRSEAAQVRRARYEDYDRRLTDFLCRPDIDEICSLIVKKADNSIGPKKVRQILELHHAGISQREIAKKVKRGRYSVHRALKKAKAWMKVA